MLSGNVGPWSTGRDDLETNDVAQFVLASALESTDAANVDERTRINASSDHITRDPIELYIRSASQGNTFALTRLGSLCDTRSIGASLMSNILEILEQDDCDGDIREAVAKGAKSVGNYLARRFWLEGAMRGNPLAQSALADDLMLQTFDTGDDDACLLAAVLFGLAAQQGSEEAMQSLQRVVEFDVSHREFESEEDLLRSTIVAVAKAAIFSREMSPSPQGMVRNPWR